MPPYLSIVATARNDDHGGNLLGRMQVFIDGLAAQCQRHGLDAELILVEWNPPAARASLREALKWPSARSAAGAPPLAIRTIEVPAEVHARFAHAQALPLFQMIAKNVGIRRASGGFVLATNIDLIFSDPLMRFLAARRLREDRMVRADRWDVPADVPAAPIDEQLRWCQKHVIRHNQREGTRDLRTGEFHRIYWQQSPRVALLETLQDLRMVPIVTRQRLHLNACGDFTLMARQRWHDLRGYPQMPMYSMHLDSVLCTAAHFGGAAEQALNASMRVYHIEHATGSGWSPEGQAALNQRLSTSGVPQLAHDEFHRWAVRMRRERRPMMFNDENWGLSEIDLPRWRWDGTWREDE